MEKFYLIDYIKKNFNIDEDILDSIKFELDRHIYFYGDNFNSPRERVATVKALLKDMLRDTSRECSVMLKALARNKPISKTNNIISNSYFSINDELRQAGYNVYKPLWCDGKYQDAIIDIGLYRESEGIKNVFARGDLIDIISGRFIKRIKGFKERLKSYYIDNNISAIIVPNDICFFENLSIKIFKEINRPSFIFLHGLPGRYNNIAENRSDYLIVWGNKIKENYVKAGFREDKILVSGHPYYKEFQGRELKFGTEDILIVTKSMPGAQHGERVHLSDRGNSILYLYSIQNVLKGMGVKSVRLRVHPSANRKWYFKFVDKDFFKLDTEDLDSSLKRSTLVIGPDSTILVESAYYGVNYLAYEPENGGVDLMNLKIFPPFDGSDARIPVAKDEDELRHMLANKVKADASFLGDYIKTPFDITFMKRYIKE